MKETQPGNSTYLKKQLIMKATKNVQILQIERIFE